MKWHKKCMHNWPVTMSIISVPIVCYSAAALSNGFPLTGFCIWCCCYGTFGGLKKLEEIQENPENVRSALNWLSQNSAWQARLAEAPRPMHMNFEGL